MATNKKVSAGKKAKESEEKERQSTRKTDTKRSAAKQPAKTSVRAAKSASSSAVTGDPKTSLTRKTTDVPKKGSTAKGGKITVPAAKTGRLSKVAREVANVASSVVKSAAKTVKAATTSVKKGTTRVSPKSAVESVEKGAKKVVKAAENAVSRTRTPGGNGRKAPVSGPAKQASTDEPVERPMRSEDEIQAPRPTDVREHYFHEHRVQHYPAPQRELPHEYGDTKICLLARDPEWVFAYWEVNDETRERFGLPRSGHNRRLVVRLYKITGRDWPNEAAYYFFDVDVSPFANNWYLKLPESGQIWCGELGMFDDENNYIAIARSNVIATPRDTLSEETDSDWMTVEETYRRLYEISGALTLQELRGSETLIRNIQKQILPSLTGESLSSGSLFSSAAVRRVSVLEKEFWLQVHTELILYGATEPDAKVTVQGRPIRLNPDGTFSLRFALPDGEQVLTVRATNQDGDMEREVTPIVTRKTRGE